MKRLTIYVGVLAVMACFSATRAWAQPNPNLDPSFGTIKLKAGFEPDPHSKGILAGGDVKTDLGGVNAHVAKNPDYRLDYTAGRYPLTFFVKSDAKTTLLINLPDGKWIASGDASPILRFAKPMSGRYDIWVGSADQKLPKATLYITELDVGGPAPDKVDKEKTGSAAFSGLPGTNWGLLSLTEKGEKITDAQTPAHVEFLKDGRWTILHYGGRLEGGTYKVNGDRLVMKTEDGAVYEDARMTFRAETRILELDSGKYLRRLRLLKSK